MQYSCTIRDLKKGEYFTLKRHYHNAVCSSSVWVRSFYCPREKAYLCYKFDDICDTRLFKADQQVFLDFTF